MKLTRKTYYATERTVNSKRGAIHEAQNCTALRPWAGNQTMTLTQKSAQTLYDLSLRYGSHRVFLCSRCKGMK